MKKLNHLKTFEQYDSSNDENLNEGLFTSLKTDISKFLNKNPSDDKAVNNMIKKAFITSFRGKAGEVLSGKVFALPIDEKISILKKAQAKLEEDDAIANLKLQYKDGEFLVGGSQAHFSVG